jgi:hypothetical protein
MRQCVCGGRGACRWKRRGQPLCPESGQVEELTSAEEGTQTACTCQLHSATLLTTCRMTDCSCSHDRRTGRSSLPQSLHPPNFTAHHTQAQLCELTAATATATSSSSSRVLLVFPMQQQQQEQQQGMGPCTMPSQRLCCRYSALTAPPVMLVVW